jgi:ATP-dependent Clp protease ATP-binding subunit ClpC
VERLDVARVVHEWAGVPLERLVEADAERFAHAEALLARGLVGHSHVVQAVARALRRGFAGFNEHRPMGSFLFLGPTGVGKTELVKILAEFVFGRRDAIVRFDMSELSEKHAVARLIGAQPGYIGYEEGGQLTEALRRKPFQIVLFDEVEKAHPDVLNLLLQLLDEGHLTDSHGRRVSFANTVVVLTSNLGASATTSRSVGFGGAPNDADAERAILEAAQRQLSAELWGRLEEKLVFLPLTRPQVQHVAALQLDESARALFAERQVQLTWDDGVIAFLLDHGGYNPDTGARGMRQAVSRHVEAPIAELILSGKLRNAAEVRLSVAPGADHVTVVCRGAKPPAKRTRPGTSPTRRS